MIKKIGLLTAYLVAASIIQGAIPPIKGVIPDFLLLIAIATACVQGPKDGLCIGIASGLIEDLMTGISGGFFTLVKGGIALLASLFRLRMVPDPIFIPLFVTFAGTLLHEWCFYGVTNLAHWKLLNYDFKGHLLPLAIVNACFAPFVFFFVQKIVYGEKPIDVK